MQRAMMSDSAEAEKQSDQFEQLNTQLLAILESLESEGTTLEQALSQFEEGMTLIRALQRALSQAEQRVVEIIGDEPPAPDLENDAT